jgi:hypothetical protein
MQAYAAQNAEMPIGLAMMPMSAPAVGGGGNSVHGARIELSMIAGPSCMRNEDDDAMFEFATGEEIMIGLCTEDSKAGEAACVISDSMGHVPVSGRRCYRHRVCGKRMSKK